MSYYLQRGEEQQRRQQQRQRRQPNSVYCFNRYLTTLIVFFICFTEITYPAISVVMAKSLNTSGFITKVLINDNSMNNNVVTATTINDDAEFNDESTVYNISTEPSTEYTILSTVDATTSILSVSDAAVINTSTVITIDNKSINNSNNNTRTMQEETTISNDISEIPNTINSSDASTSTTVDGDDDDTEPPLPEYKLCADNKNDLFTDQITVVTKYPTWRATMRQAAIMDKLEQRFVLAGFRNIQFIVLHAPSPSTSSSSSNIKRFNDTTNAMISPPPTSPPPPTLHMYTNDNYMNPNILIGQGDHLFARNLIILKSHIYDQCNRLTFIIEHPWNSIVRPYVKAAILSTIYDQPCGKCQAAHTTPSYPQTSSTSASASYSSSSSDHEFPSTQPTLIPMAKKLNTGATDEIHSSKEISQINLNVQQHLDRLAMNVNNIPLTTVNNNFNKKQLPNDSGPDISNINDHEIDDSEENQRYIIPIKIILPMEHVHPIISSKNSQSDDSPIDNEINLSDKFLKYNYILLKTSDKTYHEHVPNDQPELLTLLKSPTKLIPSDTNNDDTATTTPPSTITTTDNNVDSSTNDKTITNTEQVESTTTTEFNIKSTEKISAPPQFIINKEIILIDSQGYRFRAFTDPKMFIQTPRPPINSGQFFLNVELEKVEDFGDMQTSDVKPSSTSNSVTDYSVINTNSNNNNNDQMKNKQSEPLKLNVQPELDGKQNYLNQDVIDVNEYYSKILPWINYSLIPINRVVNKT